MRAFYSLSLLAVLLVQAGCASGNHAGQSDISTQIANLERTHEQVKSQYIVLGDNLKRLEARIVELKGQQQRNVATLPAPAPAAAPAREEVSVAAAAEPAEKPTELAAQVGDLTDEDIKEQPAAVATSDKPASAPPATDDNKRFLVHMASYLETAQVMPGWRQLSDKYQTQVNGLKPYLTVFSDGQQRRWLRLSAGPLTSGDVATRRCDAIKQAGGWCEVLATDKSAMRPLLR